MIEIRDRDIQDAMRVLGRAFRADKTNRVLKRELMKRLRTVMRPMVEERKARVLALPSKGHSQPGGSMRQAVARKVAANTRWSGDRAGLSIVQRARGMPRDFQYAGRMFNREEGWNPTNLGGVSETQVMRPADWFDGASDGDYPAVRHEVVQAIAEAADSIARDIRAG